MTLPGETEAGSAGTQPCRGIAWWAHRDDVGRGGSPFAPFPKTHRIGRPLCLENPRPEGAEYSLTESAPAPFHAEPEHLHNLKTLGTIFSFDTLEMFQVQDGTEELPNRRLVINHMRDAVAQRRLRCLRR